MEDLLLGAGLRDILIPRKQFIKEHKNLLKVLKTGNKKEMKKEYQDQKKELQKELRGGGFILEVVEQRDRSGNVKQYYGVSDTARNVVIYMTDRNPKGKRDALQYINFLKETYPEEGQYTNPKELMGKMAPPSSEGVPTPHQYLANLDEVYDTAFFDPEYYSVSRQRPIFEEYNIMYPPHELEGQYFRDTTGTLPREVGQRDIEAFKRKKGRGVSKASGFIRRMMAENKKKHTGQYKKPTFPLAKDSTMNAAVEFDLKKLASKEQGGLNKAQYGASPFIEKHFKGNPIVYPAKPYGKETKSQKIARLKATAKRIGKSITEMETKPEVEVKEVKKIGKMKKRDYTDRQRAIADLLEEDPKATMRELSENLEQLEEGFGTSISAIHSDVLLVKEDMGIKRRETKPRKARVSAEAVGKEPGNRNYTKFSYDINGDKERIFVERLLKENPTMTQAEIGRRLKKEGFKHFTSAAVKFILRSIVSHRESEESHRKIMREYEEEQKRKGLPKQTEPIAVKGKGKSDDEKEKKTNKVVFRIGTLREGEDYESEDEYKRYIQGDFDITGWTPRQVAILEYLTEDKDLSVVEMTERLEEYVEDQEEDFSVKPAEVRTDMTFVRKELEKAKKKYEEEEKKAKEEEAKRKAEELKKKAEEEEFVIEEGVVRFTPEQMKEFARRRRLARKKREAEAAAKKDEEPGAGAGEASSGKTGKGKRDFPKMCGI